MVCAKKWYLEDSLMAVHQEQNQPLTLGPGQIFTLHYGLLEGLTDEGPVVGLKVTEGQQVCHVSVQIKNTDIII